MGFPCEWKWVCPGGSLGVASVAAHGGAVSCAAVVLHCACAPRLLCPFVRHWTSECFQILTAGTVLLWALGCVCLSKLESVWISAQEWDCWII